ncbi:MAG: ABC transporter substrate-binding protein [Chloroflexi bacterium]|nr:ABC transporter substrate-binding protein [Chloroflexota bacterium]
MRRFVFVFAFSLTVVLALAGCAGQQTAPKPTLGELKLSIDALRMHAVALYIADRQGYFKDEGFDSVNTIVTGGGTVQQQALQGGDVEYAIGSTTGAADATLAGRPEVILMSMTGQWNTNFTIRKDSAQRFGITEGMTIAQKFGRLKGAKIAITNPGAGSDEIVRFMLKQGGIDPDHDVELVALSTSSAIVAALEKGTVDVIALSPPDTDITVVRGYATRLVTLSKGEFEPVRGATFIGLMALKEKVESEPERTQAVVNALVRGAKLIKDRPDEAKAIVRPVWPEMEDAVFEEGWQVMLPALSDPKLKKEGIDGALNVGFVAFGKKREIGYEQLAVSKFVDNAMKSLGWQ